MLSILDAKVIYFLWVIQIKLFFSYLLKQVLLFTMDHHQYVHIHKDSVCTIKRIKMIHLEFFK